MHRDTLKLVVDLVNKQALEKQQAQQAAEEDQRRREQQHVDNVRKVADEIQFD